MNFKSGHWTSRDFSIQNRLAAMFVLITLLSAVFPILGFSSHNFSTPENSVYCPLLKKFQPINPVERKKEKKPFEAICASSKAKDFLFQEIVLKTPWKVFTLDAENLENLVFDYLAHGKSAFGKLPYAPNAPSENRVERIAGTVISNTRDEHKFAWKYSAIAAVFSPNFKARPPTAGKNLFAVQIVRQLEEISHCIAPRAPPFLS